MSASNIKKRKLDWRIELAIFIFVVLLVIASVAVYVIHSVEYHKSGMAAYTIEGFSKYKEDFNVISNKANELFLKYSQNYDTQKIVITQGADGLIVSFLDMKFEEPLSPKEKISYQKVMEACNSKEYLHGLASVGASQNGVEFRTWSRYSIVNATSYKSLENIIEERSSSGSYYTHKLSRGWYEVLA